jgi:hypothetical protein
LVTVPTGADVGWGRGGVGPGADAGWYEPSPVVGDERSPKLETQMRAKGLEGMNRTTVVPSTHCAALCTHRLRCNLNVCHCVQLPVERCSGAVHCCRLRCDATRASSALSGWAHSRGATVLLGADARTSDSGRSHHTYPAGTREAVGHWWHWQRVESLAQMRMDAQERSPAQTQMWAGTGQLFC